MSTDALGLFVSLTQGVSEPAMLSGRVAPFWLGSACQSPPFRGRIRISIAANGP
ncbi:hypothetical protein L218DRAFT_966293 [Marasmius fiardii PR-910]|nr:hypothetical protein L218DRAFT_966293 [Marasmius fiardii PR-910]